MPAMRTKLLIAAAVLAGLVAVVPAQAAKPKRAYFLAKVTALQTIKWSSMSRVYTDCNGKQYQRGNGTEVVRIDSGRPEKVTIEGRGRTANVTAYGKWVKGPSLSAIPGLLSDMVITRQRARSRASPRAAGAAAGTPTTAGRTTAASAGV